MRILHTSDWHVGKRLGRHDRMDEHRAAMAEVARVAVDEDVDLVLHSGDLYDRPMPPVDALQAGLELSEYVMPGLGGEALSREHALESARVITAISPHFTRLRSLGIRRGTPIRLMAEGGRFSPLDDDALVAEIRLFVEHLEGAHTRLVSDHILNLLGDLEGRLPEELPGLLGILDAYLDLPDHERELFRLGRRAGLLHSTADLGHPGLRSAVEDLSRKVADMGRSVGDICAELLERMI